VIIAVEVEDLLALDTHDTVARLAAVTNATQAPLAHPERMHSVRPMIDTLALTIICYVVGQSTCAEHNHIVFRCYFFHSGWLMLCVPLYVGVRRIKGFGRCSMLFIVLL